MGDGSRMSVEEIVFEFRIANSAVRFPQSRYYWLETKKNDSRVSVLNIGITPRKMSKQELDVFQHAAQTQLRADGWMPGHYVAESKETVLLWGGERTAGDGRYWLKGGTLLIFERKRIDDQVRDEPEGSGEFIVDLLLRPGDHDKKLIFEQSAWKE